MPVEEPAFQLRLHEGAFEVRDYPSRVVAEVVVDGGQKQAVGDGFRILAGYIFGKNSRNQSIAMTAPVTQFRTGETIGRTAPWTAAQGGGGWVVRFNMPRRYALDALPAPRDARVRLRAIPPAQAAVLRFSGLAEPADVERRAAELSAWVRSHRLRATGAASLAQYDPPWTLWFLRRNEVMIPVAA